MDDVSTLIQFIQGFIPEKPKKQSFKEDTTIFDKAMLYSIAAPTIVDKRWPEIPDELKLQAKAHRIAEALKCVKEEMATEFDAFVFLHTTSLAQPLDHHLYNIFFYLFRKYFPEQAEQLNINIQELDGYEKTLLNELRSWIFKQQINAVKQRIRGEILFTGLFSYFILFGWLESSYCGQYPPDKQNTMDEQTEESIKLDNFIGGD